LNFRRLKWKGRGDCHRPGDVFDQLRARGSYIAKSFFAEHEAIAKSSLLDDVNPIENGVMGG
jgi:hypothetical protein